MADWTSAPKDILLLISNRLTHSVDYVRFRSVCPSWRAAAPRRHHLPWLIAHRPTDADSDDEDEDELRTIFSFYTFSPDGISSLPPPPMPMPSMACCGSSHGWMAMLDPSQNPSIALLNPVTGSQIPLPPLQAYPHLNLSSTRDDNLHVFKGSDQNYWSNKVVLSADPLTSSSDCIVMAIRCFHQVLEFCRPGDDAWTPVQCPYFSHDSAKDTIRDVVFYQGRIYATSTSKVYACDAAPTARLTEIPLIDPWSMYSSAVVMDPAQGRDCYLVESDADLLLVRTCQIKEYVYWDDIEEVVHHLLYRFEVFKLIWGVNGNRTRLEQIRSLGDRSLFLGRNQSISFPANTFLGCEENSIYVVPSLYWGDPSKIVRAINLKDETDFLRIPSSQSSSKLEAFAWIMPNLLSGDL